MVSGKQLCRRLVSAISALLLVAAGFVPAADPPLAATGQNMVTEFKGKLKGFQRVHLHPSELKTVRFKLNTSDLSFYNRRMEFVAEEGEFEVWIGGDSNANLKSSFRLI